MKSADNEDFKSGRIQARFAKDGLDLWVAYQRDNRDTDGEAVLKNTLGAPQPSFDPLPPFRSDAPTRTVLEGERIRWEASYSGLGPAPDHTLKFRESVQSSKIRSISPPVTFAILCPTIAGRIDPVLSRTNASTTPAKAV